jgi:hypothetical protein
LEVEVALAKAFFSFGNPFEKTLLKRRQARTALDFLVNGNMLGFQDTLESILADINYHLHVPYEAFYQTVFQFVLDPAGQPYDSESPVSDGRYDIHFMASTRGRLYH